MVYSDYGDNTATYGDTGSGSALDSILNSVTALGQSAITSFAPAPNYSPQNGGLATNPGGYGVLPGTKATSNTLMTVVVLFVLVFAGLFLWKRL